MSDAVNDLTDTPGHKPQDRSGAGGSHGSSAELHVLSGLGSSAEGRGLDAAAKPTTDLTLADDLHKPTPTQPMASFGEPAGFDVSSTGLDAAAGVPGGLDLPALPTLLPASTHDPLDHAATVDSRDADEVLHSPIDDSAQDSGDVIELEAWSESDNAPGLVVFNDAAGERPSSADVGSFSASGNGSVSTSGTGTGSSLGSGSRGPMSRSSRSSSFHVQAPGRAEATVELTDAPLVERSDDTPPQGISLAQMAAERTSHLLAHPTVPAAEAEVIPQESAPLHKEDVAEAWSVMDAAAFGSPRAENPVESPNQTSARQADVDSTLGPAEDETEAWSVVDPGMIELGRTIGETAAAQTQTSSPEGAADDAVDETWTMPLEDASASGFITLNAEEAEDEAFAKADPQTDKPTVAKSAVGAGAAESAQPRAMAEAGADTATESQSSWQVIGHDGPELTRPAALSTKAIGRITPPGEQGLRQSDVEAGGSVDLTGTQPLLSEEDDRETWSVMEQDQTTGELTEPAIAPPVLDAVATAMGMVEGRPVVADSRGLTPAASVVDKPPARSSVEFVPWDSLPGGQGNASVAAPAIDPVVETAIDAVATPSSPPVAATAEGWNTALTDGDGWTALTDGGAASEAVGLEPLSSGMLIEPVTESTVPLSALPDAAGPGVPQPAAPSANLAADLGEVAEPVVASSMSATPVVASVAVVERALTRKELDRLVAPSPLRRYFDQVSWSVRQVLPTVVDVPAAIGVAPAVITPVAPAPVAATVAQITDDKAGAAGAAERTSVEATPEPVLVQTDDAALVRSPLQLFFRGVPWTGQEYDEHAAVELAARGLPIIVPVDVSTVLPESLVVSPVTRFFDLVAWTGRQAEVPVRQTQSVAVTPAGELPAVSVEPAAVDYARAVRAWFDRVSWHAEPAIVATSMESVLKSTDRAIAAAKAAVQTSVAAKASAAVPTVGQALSAKMLPAEQFEQAADSALQKPLAAVFDAIPWFGLDRPEVDSVLASSAPVREVSATVQDEDRDALARRTKLLEGDTDTKAVLAEHLSRYFDLVDWSGAGRGSLASVSSAMEPLVLPSASAPVRKTAADVSIAAARPQLRLLSVDTPELRESRLCVFMDAIPWGGPSDTQFSHIPSELPVEPATTVASGASAPKVVDAISQVPLAESKPLALRLVSDVSNESLQTGLQFYFTDVDWSGRSRQRIGA